MKAKMALPENEFKLNNIYRFLELIFDDEHRIGIAATLLERLRQKRETYVEDWLEIILEYLGDEELLDYYNELLRQYDEGEISKTKINKLLEKEMNKRGYRAAKLRNDWVVVKKTLIELGIISRTSNRLNLSWDFIERLNILSRFYNLWRAGEL